MVLIIILDIENVNNNNRLITDYFKVKNNKNNRKNKLITDYFKNKKLVANVKEASNRRRYNRRQNILKINGVHSYNIRKDFKIHTEDPRVELYNLAVHNDNDNQEQKDFIKNIMISVHETKDNWYDTTSQLSQEQNDTI